MLVVDGDNRGNEFLTACVCNLTGITVKSCFNFEDAQSFLKSFRCSVAFVSIDIDSASAFDFAECVKRHNPTVNVIFVSRTHGFEMRAIKCHASGYLVRPFDNTDVSREFENLIYPLTKQQPILV